MSAKRTCTVNNVDHPVIRKAFERVRSIARAPEENMKIVDDWIDKAILYNVPHGKLNRLLQVIQTFELMSAEPVTNEALESAACLGWAIECLQAFALVLDDIMDKSQTRRGQPCWYLVENVGLQAANDSVLLLMVGFKIIEKVFSNHPAYVELTQLLLQLTNQVSRGQCMDMQQEGTFDFSEEKYNLLATYKTALYTFSVPIRFGMYLAGVTDPEIHKKVEKISIKIGILFQAQDDFLDCYGEPATIGKVGTDIVDGKHSWLVVQAMQMATKDQKNIILSNIHKGKPGGPEERAVKLVYEQLKMHDFFRKYEERTFAEIRAEIQQLSNENSFDTRILSLTLDKIDNRKK